MDIRKASLDDLQLVTEQTLLLYKDTNFDDLLVENKNLIEDENQIFFLGFELDKCIGFAHCSLRHDYVEGTGGGKVAYLEGIYVTPEPRKQGVASAFLVECEKWGLSKGCREIASDCEHDNQTSYDFHLSVGFREVNRLICFTKKITV
ncbi:MAG: GNAT family N-acetyltransferase [Firmicutes bacterium]|nr:GNAT family N-acetyltransferase [Bacillota bacterium]MDD4694518.1 GNAT family N-acetyltransferase [Bacillota bacterium]